MKMRKSLSSIYPSITAKWLLFWLLISTLQMSIGGDETQEAPFGEHVDRVCNFTRYPSLCIGSLLGSGSSYRRDFVSALVERTRNETRMPTSNLPHLSYEDLGLDSKRSLDATGYCSELMELSVKHLNQSLLALKHSRRKSKPDIQTWLSASLTFQLACKDSVQGLSGDLVSQIAGKMSYLSKLASNALALANRITGGPKATIGRRLMSDDNYPAWLYARTKELVQVPAIKANAIVAKDGSGNYRTISEAINAASGGRFVIYVKAGVYEEKIHTNKDGITLIGDGKYSTIITGDDSVGSGSSTPGSATFTITGDGFIARDIGFRNTAGPYAGQALALTVSSDRSVLYRCSVMGYQDTLYASANRQFFRECDIGGTVDFIFGNAAAVFQNCNIMLRRAKAQNFILANGRSDPGQNTGFSIQNCKIMASSELSPVKHSVESYLGRPYKEYSRSVIMQSFIDDAIASSGWAEWDGNFALKTLYFGEYLNEGPGAGTSGRVKWPGYHVLGLNEAMKFTVNNFIDGSSWLPSTGVTFKSGLS